MADVDPTVQIARDLRALPEATRKAVRPRLREAGQIIAEDAKQRADWSTRIPATVRVTTSFRENRENVKVLAGGPSAPHARPYEGISSRGNTFRHPVFGHVGGWRTERGIWVEQETRPFLLPAAEARADEATGFVRTALDDAALSLGFS